MWAQAGERRESYLTEDWPWWWRVELVFEHSWRERTHKDAGAIQEAYQEQSRKKI